MIRCTTLVLAALLAGCRGTENQSAPATVPFTAAEIQRFDRITAAGTLFPKPEDQALYSAMPPEDREGQRHYVFSLKLQPGMRANRHFQTITISWAHGGVFAGRESNTGGPNGGMISQAVTTPDGRYDVRVSMSELLPDTARTPPTQIDALTRALIERYRLAQ